MRFALLAALAVQLAAPPAPPAQVLEPASQVSFPVHLTPPGGATAQELSGTAIRTKTIFRVKVYAFGLYVDVEAARSALGRYQGEPADRLSNDEGFFRRLLEFDVPMTLRLVMTRDVGGKDVASSFDDALTPRMRRAAERGLAGGDAALAEFRGFFNLDEVARGTEIVFSCSRDGRLVTTVAAAARPEIRSRALCWALFDVYLGEKPISKDARANLIVRLPGILASRGARAPG